MNNFCKQQSTMVSTVQLKEVGFGRADASEAPKKRISRPETCNAIRAYLSEIGRIPLLTHEQEITYGKQVQQLMTLLKARDVLRSQLCREPSRLEWSIYANLGESELSGIVQRGERAKKKMIEANLRLVVSVAKKYQKRNMEFLDLIQEGSLGLIRGIEKFDPAKGYRLSTYCWHWIRQAITRAIGLQAHTIRLPIHIIEKLNKIKKVQRELSQYLGRTATIAEVATELGTTPQQIRQYLQLSRHTSSLESRVGKNEDTELGELLQDISATPEEKLIEAELALDLEWLMDQAKLTHQQREVIALRFGLVDGKQLTLSQIGQRLNFSRERIRQIEKIALKQLHQVSACLDQGSIPNVSRSRVDEDRLQAGQPALDELPIASLEIESTPIELAIPILAQKPQQLMLFAWENGIAIVPPAEEPFVSVSVA